MFCSTIVVTIICKAHILPYLHLPFLVHKCFHIVNYDKMQCTVMNGVIIAVKKLSLDTSCPQWLQSRMEGPLVEAALAEMVAVGSQMSMQQRGISYEMLLSSFPIKCNGCTRSENALQKLAHHARKYTVHYNDVY